MVERGYESVPEDTSNSLLVKRANQFPITLPDLAAHIESVLNVSDVMIADLTTQNPNVNIEIGYALALRKPIVYVTQDRKDVPAYLQGKIVEEYSPLDKESLERLSIVMLNRVLDQLAIVNAQKDVQSAKMEVEAHYVVDCYAQRADAPLAQYFRQAKEQIDILTTSLTFLFRKHRESLDGKAPGARSYFDEIVAAFERPGSALAVRILTLDPESHFAAKRGRQLGFSPANFRTQLKAALERTKEIAANYQSERFEVRTYDDFPNQITYGIDDAIINCVVAQPTQSRNHLSIKFDRRQQGVERSFLTHFETVWRNASPGC